LLIVLLLVLGLAAPAHGQDMAEAHALYDRGVMLKAAELARGFGTADGYALASQSTLVAAVYQRPGHDHALLQQAAADARAALALDPDHVAALLQLALALGYMADQDPIGAHFDGTADEGKALLDRALALAPDNAWAHGMLGVWHLRLVKYAGPLLAQSLYDASLDRGREQCAEAATLAPDDLAMRFGCAISLMEAQPGRYTGQAVEVLDTVVRLPAKDAAAALVQAEARRRLAAIKSELWD
jgi:tetratricopeptide (TPR) repeat protein